MTNPRIASVLLVAFTASIFVAACSSDSDGGSPAGTGAGTGGTSTTGKGGAGPTVLKGGAGGNGEGGGDLFGGGETAAGGTDSSAGGASSGKGGGTAAGGAGPSEADCQDECADANKAGVDFFNNSFVAECACAAGSTCNAACGAACGGAMEVDEACGKCLDGVKGTDKCIEASTTACQADAGCKALFTCVSGCGGGGTGTGDPCQDACVADNQAGVAVYNDAFKDIDACICKTTCAADCSADLICTKGSNEGEKACVDCANNTCIKPSQDKCKASPDCTSLSNCLAKCP